MWPGRQTLAGSFRVGLTTSPLGHTLYDMQVLALIPIYILAGLIGWYVVPVGDYLARRRLVRRCHYYGVLAVASAMLAAIIAWHVGPNAVTGLWLLLAADFTRKAWKHRNDDDRNDRLRRLWAKAKTRLPKPRLIPIRPVGVPT